MNSPAYDIAQILAGISGMGIFGTDIFTGHEPSSPDNCITIYDTGGFAPDVAEDYQRPTIQIRVRNKAYNVGYGVIYAIKKELHGTSRQEGGVNYTGIWVMSDIIPLGYDSNLREIFTCNFRIHRTPAT